MMCSFTRFGLGMVLVAVLVSGIGNSTQIGLAQNCTVTVKPGESIQKAVDAASVGAVVCLEAGTWQENLAISKSMTLRGVGRDRVIVNSADEGKPVIRIESDGVIEVSIEGFAVVKAKGILGGDGIAVRGIPVVRGMPRVSIKDLDASENEGFGISVVGAAQVSLTNCKLSGNSGGLGAISSAQVDLIDSIVSGNKFYGLTIENSSQANLTNMHISENGDGLYAGGDAIVNLTRSVLSGNQRYGVEAAYRARVSLLNSTVSGNQYGLSLALSQTNLIDSTVSNNEEDGLLVFGGSVSLEGSAISGNGQHGLFIDGSGGQVSLMRSSVSQNGRDGISMLGSVATKLEVHSSIIKGNGTNPDCKKLGPEFAHICNGITVQAAFQTEIADSEITSNTDWGVAARLKQCGYDHPLFVYEVEFQGKNVIEGNNTSGNQNGMGNPGWKGPVIPDGQMCLP